MTRGCHSPFGPRVPVCDGTRAAPPHVARSMHGGALRCVEVVGGRGAPAVANGVPSRAFGCADDAATSDSPWLTLAFSLIGKPTPHTQAYPPIPSRRPYNQIRRISGQVRAGRSRRKRRTGGRSVTEEERWGGARGLLGGSRRRAAKRTFVQGGGSGRRAREQHAEGGSRRAPFAGIGLGQTPGPLRRSHLPPLDHRWAGPLVGWGRCEAAISVAGGPRDWPRSGPWPPRCGSPHQAALEGLFFGKLRPQPPPQLLLLPPGPFPNHLLCRSGPLP